MLGYNLEGKYMILDPFFIAARQYILAPSLCGSSSKLCLALDYSIHGLSVPHLLSCAYRVLAIVGRQVCTYNQRWPRWDKKPLDLKLESQSVIHARAAVLRLTLYFYTWHINPQLVFNLELLVNLSPHTLIEIKYHLEISQNRDRSLCMKI